MDELDRNVSDLSASVWEQTIGFPLEPTGDEPAHPAHTVEGHVHISGNWTGTVILQCSFEAAQQAADVMFGANRHRQASQDAQDAVGELTNMIGGNLKALLSESGCFLSIPTVIEGSGYSVRMPGAKVLARQTFAAATEPVVVTLLGPLGA